jgi:predicted AlkP superfamily phosphohydrolase/phosphomutase
MRETKINKHKEEVYGTRKKCVLLGLDSVNLDLVERFAKEGYLPNMRLLMEEGIVSETFPAIPTGTAMNWTCIATGASVGTHGIVEMILHLPGTSLSERFQSFTTERCQADYIWNAAERQGKKVILLRYPASWPPTIKKGLQVEGVGNPDWSPFQIGPRLGFSTEKMRERNIKAYGAGPKEISHAYKIEFKKAQEWKNMPSSNSSPLETILKIHPMGGKKAIFYALLIDSKGKGYDRFFLSEEKDVEKSLCCISEGQWSNFLKAEFITSKGKEEGNLRVKLVELSKDAKKFRLYLSQIFPSTGWTYPEELARELTEHIGRPYQLLCDIYSPILGGWIDSKTYLEEMENQMTWLAEAGEHLMKNKDWDMLFAQWHGIDYTDHCYLGGMDPESSAYKKERTTECEEVIRKVYQMADTYLGRLMKVAGEDAVICVVSDHGHMTPRRVFHCNNFLAREGLVAYKENENGNPEVNWSKTKVFSPFGSYIYVNLAGREKGGIVDPKNYERIREKVIDLFRNLKDIETGENIVNMILKKEEAGILGQHGDRVGDIVYTLNPKYNDETAWLLTKELSVIDDPPYESKEGIYPFAGVHHTYLPSSRQNLGSMKAVLLMKGPGIKRGYRRKVPARTIDVAPTMAYLLGIQPPKDTEGSVLHDLVKNTK